MTSRTEIAALITERLKASQERLAEEFFLAGRINSFVVDDLLPAELAESIFKAFPAPDRMVLKKTLREHKYIAVQMDRYEPLLEEAIYAFQDPGVLRVIAELTQLEQLTPDEHLYAGGISLMNKGCFLNPHLDNSHDRDRANYRALNLLYYVTPDWTEENGGNLELWDGGLKEAQRTLVSRFNRLAVMITNRSSWHSVSPVQVERNRCCLSNYYFSPASVDAEAYFHVTSFRGRPDEPFVDLMLQGDRLLRNGVRKIFKKGVVANPHVYKK